MAINYYDKTFEDSTSKALDAGIAVVLYTSNRFEGENAPSDPRIPLLAVVGQDESTSGGKLAQAFPAAATCGSNRCCRPAIRSTTLNLDNSGNEGEYLSVIGLHLQAHP